MIHHALKIIGNCPVGNRFVNTLDDKLRRFVPSEVTKHHNPTEDHRARVDFIKSGILWSSSMSRLEDCMSRLVVNVPSWGNTNSTNLRCKCITQIIPIQIHRCDNIKVIWSRKYLLQRNICNRIFDHQLFLVLSVSVGLVNRINAVLHFSSQSFLLIVCHHVVTRFDHFCVRNNIIYTLVFVANNPALTLRNHLVSVLLNSHFVAPVLERTLGELHNISLVHKCDGFVVTLQSIFNSCTNKAICALFGNWFYPKARCLRKANLINTHLLMQKLVKLFGFR
mmetsp:Transcript_6234/g.9850  ORF Transcript_6234/g.9850 Transcript_6234/m.9850 type:complete len:280 (+) Transcript_6234:1948-2787(+)